MSHGDSVVQLPPGFSVVAKSDQVHICCDLQLCRHTHHGAGSAQFGWTQQMCSVLGIAAAGSTSVFGQTHVSVVLWSTIRGQSWGWRIRRGASSGCSTTQK